MPRGGETRVSVGRHGGRRTVSRSGTSPHAPPCKPSWQNSDPKLGFFSHPSLLTTVLGDLRGEGTRWMGLVISGDTCSRWSLKEGWGK